MAISKDDVSYAAEMRELLGAEYVILADPEGVAVNAFGVDDLLGDGLAAPSTFIIGSDGVVRWAYVAEDDADRPTASQTLAALTDTALTARYTLFEDETLGISFMRPETWISVPAEIGNGEGVGADREVGAPWAILEGEDGVTLEIMLEFNEPDADLRRVIADAIESLATEGEIPSLESLTSFTLESGQPALRTELLLKSDDADAKAIVQAAMRGHATFVITASGRVDALADQQEAIDTLFDTFQTSVPSPYGIDRNTAFTMPLGEPSTLDPAVARETLSHFYVSAIYSGLVRLDEALSVTPDLAESWEVDESGTVYTFTLRDGITFHDGKPITAADFKRSIERATDPELHSDTALLYLDDIVGALAKMEGEAEEVSGFEVVDERTIRITIDSPKEYFLAKLSYPSSYVVDVDSVGALGDEWWADGNVNGAGPYTLHSWDSDEAIILKWFDGYHTPVAMQHVISPFAALPGAGGLDMYQSGYWDGIYVGVNSLDGIRGNEAVSDQLHEFDQLVTYFVVMDTDLPPLDDAKARRAFAMAVDRQKLIDDLYGGNLQLANGLLPPGIPGYSEDLRGIPFDAEEARRLLAESGYAGELPEMTFIGVDRNGSPSATVQFLLDSWKENLGVEVKANLLESDEYFYHLEEQEGHFLTYGWVADYPDPENFLDLLLHSEAHDSRYSNPAFDTLLEMARETQDRQARLELYQKAEQLLMDDTGIIPLFHVQEYVLIKPYVQNFAIGPVGQPDVSNVEYEGGP